MNIVLTAGVLLIMLSLAFQKNKKIQPYWGFLIVFIIMGFQEGVQGDFMGYKESFQIMARGGVYDSVTSENDYVWLFLTKLFSSFMPFWMFVILLAGFECGVLYKVGNNYGSKEYGWVGPVLFFFTFYMMLIQMKAMRQGLATEIVVLAYYLSDKKKGFWWSIALMALAMFVHHSTLAAVPFIALQLVVSRKKDWDKEVKRSNFVMKDFFPLLMVGAYLFVYYLKASFLGDWLSQLAILMGDDVQLVGYLEKEQRFLDQGVSSLIILYDGVMVFLCSWFMQRTDRRYRVLAIASIIGCFLDMLLFGMGSLPRIAMFYIVFNILTYPKLVEVVSHKYGKTVALVLIVFLVGYAVKTSLPWITGTDGDQFGTYRFVFWQ